MKKAFIRIISCVMVVIMALTSAPLGGLVGLDIGEMFSEKAVAASYKVGDIIRYGNYPQSEVKDSTTLKLLNATNTQWKSYNYYSGTGSWSDGKMKPSDYMQYRDVDLDSSRYRAVKFTQYRPYCTGHTHSSSNSYQDDNGYYVNSTYWFKYEPLKWRVLDPSTGLIMCESIIDSQAYQNTIYCYSSLLLSRYNKVNLCK
ncbi:MAG: hypothetical protein NC122_10555 [Faecalibacterium sp.]|nr:hypothetical protein [Ruminococcus sp.]MCM1393152.1 hypothetical protein [Ruminococcus sp.]MCM1486630.1 hypothetical protein [Faecalibacterium sp.]